MTRNQPPRIEPDCDVVVVGAGFAGIYALRQARQRGFSVRGFERGADVGGTWYWNAYPGARCDVESYNYAYFFDDDIVRDWDWSDACAGHDEIQRYLRFAAERCDVLKDIAFNTKVQSVSYDEDSGWWSLRTGAGETVVCRYVVLAIGALSDPKPPDINGVDDFAGETYFTSSWPKDGSVDLSGKRVGVIGTGSSGVQVIPEVAKVAAKVCVFQRTANYVTATRSGPMDPDVVAELREDPQATRRAFRETYGGHTPLDMGDERFVELDAVGRDRVLQQAWDGKYIQLAFRDAYLPEANTAISDFIRQRMHDQVNDAWTADHLVPWDHPYGGLQSTTCTPHRPARDSHRAGSPRGDQDDYRDDTAGRHHLCHGLRCHLGSGLRHRNLGYGWTLDERRVGRRADELSRHDGPRLS
jgi:cation diffusion facilitator CzcD-associated flavoprotein CzcO